MAAKSARFTDSAPIFAALGDPTRLRLVARLCAGGPQSIAGLTAGSKVTRQAVSKHLRILAGAGLARAERHGRESRWALDSEQIEVARGYLDLMSEQWTRRLAALGRHLDAMVKTTATRPRTSRRPIRSAGSDRPM